MELSTFMTSYQRRREFLSHLYRSASNNDLIRLDVFGRVALNLDFDCIEDGSPEIRRKWREQSNAVIQPDGFKVGFHMTIRAHT